MRAMRAIAVALSTLLLGAGLLSSAGAQAATTQGCSRDSLPAATKIPSGVIQLAEGGKLGDRYLAGRAGGRYGIGGTESRKFKKKRSKGEAGTRDGWLRLLSSMESDWSRMGPMWTAT